MNVDGEQRGEWKIKTGWELRRGRRVRAEDVGEVVTPTGNQKPQNQTPQQKNRIIRRTQAQGWDVSDRGPGRAEEGLRSAGNLLKSCRGKTYTKERRTPMDNQQPQSHKCIMRRTGAQERESRYITG